MSWSIFTAAANTWEPTFSIVFGVSVKTNVTSPIVGATKGGSTNRCYEGTAKKYKQWNHFKSVSLFWAKAEEGLKEKLGRCADGLTQAKMTMDKS